MQAMLLPQIVHLDENQTPLILHNIPIPKPGDNEVLIQVAACGVCHTELDEIEGRTLPAFFPMILGHQVTGKIVELGKYAFKYPIETRVGIAWFYSSCGQCEFCRNGFENLCPEFKATGRDAHGGYAEYMVAPEDAVFPLPEQLDSIKAAPLLCAGAIGYRSLRLANLSNGRRLGLCGFGASAHLVLKLVRYLYPNTPVYVFARSEQERQFAISLGAEWAGDFTDQSPVKLHAIIDTTPVWFTIVNVLKNLLPNGRLVINAIRKETSDIHSLTTLDYARDLWLEKELKSVANVTRQDVAEFLHLAAVIPIIPEVETYQLAEANRALWELKNRHIRGAKVLLIGETTSAAPI